MKLEELAGVLHENERRILLGLRELEFATTEVLSNITGLSLDAVEKASAWAETKGVLSFSEKVSRKFSITNEGKKYVQEGLPEKRLLDLVSQGITKINELKKELSSLSIALVWLRRNDWGIIVQGEVKLTNNGVKAREKRTPEEKILDRLMAEELEESRLNELEIEVVEIL
jgi:phenylalanyl-tRNA synthetase alpha chain